MRSPERRYKSLWLGCLLIAMICSYAHADSGEMTGIDVLTASEKDMKKAARQAPPN